MNAKSIGFVFLISYKGSVIILQYQKCPYFKIMLDDSTKNLETDTGCSIVDTM